MNSLTLLSRTLQHSRRTFLLRTAGTLAFPLALAGCGGGGGDDISGTTGDDPGAGTGSGAPLVALTPSTARGSIVLPAGATVKVVAVENAFGSSVPAADGGFDFVSVAESEMFAIGLGPNGKMVLSGLLQAGSAQLSARSTALCLAYTALGVGVYVPAMQEQFLTAIQAAPSLAALEAAVAAAIVARGEGWLDFTDPVLKSAVATVQAAFAPMAPAPAAKPADPGAPMLRGMVIDRTDRVSGIQITGDGVGTITLTNFYRRRSYAYIDRVSYKTSYTGAAIDSPATVGVQPMKIDATKSITNTLLTIAQLLGGDRDFYDPVVYDGIPTPLTPTDAAITTYHVTSVGLGINAGDLALLSASQREGLRNVCAETFVLDIAVPIFCGILIPLRTAPMKTFIETFALSRLKDLITALAASDDILLNKIVARDRPLKEVLWDTLLLLVNTDTLKNAILGFAQDVINALSVNGSLPPTNFYNAGAERLLSALSAVDLTAQTMDLVAVGLSIAYSDLADQFSVDVNKSAVRLNPQSPQLDPASLLPTNFTLSVIDSDLVAGDLSYEWSCACLFGDISSGPHSNLTDGTTFRSSSANLAYAPRGHGKGGDQDVITGKVYKGNSNTPNSSTRVLVGTATSIVSYNTAISPASVQLLINTQQTFTADISSTLLASGTAPQYVWTLVGPGSIGGSAVVTTTTPSIVYTAPSAVASASLSLSVRTATGTVLSTGSASIGVLGSVVAGIAPQNPRVPRSTVLNFTVVPAGAAFPSGSTFKWVLTEELDLFGRSQPIYASGGGTIGVNVSPLPRGVSPGTSVTVVTTSPTITFAANPFGTEATGDTFVWNPSLVLAVTVLNAAGSILATSSTPIQTQLPTSILLP